MFNFTTICESVRRHWLAIALVAVLSLALAVGSSYVKNGEIQAAPTYTAETVLYVTSYGYDTKAVPDGGDYNYTLDEANLKNDVRHLVLSSEVSAAVRTHYGENLQITSPRWIDERTNLEVNDRFIYIDATGENPQIVKDAADEVARLTIAQAKKLLPVGDIVVAEPAVMKTSDNAHAANWGSDKLVNDPGKASVKHSVSKKSLVIYLFVGLVLSIGGFAAYDILSRRIRSPRDIERLLDMPVLANLGNEGEDAILPSNVRVLLRRNSFKNLTLAVLGNEETLNRVKAVLDADIVNETTLLSRDALAAEKIAQSDSCLLVVKEAFNKGSEIQNAMKDLAVADVAVLGAVFVPKKLN